MKRFWSSLLLFAALLAFAPYVTASSTIPPLRPVSLYCMHSSAWIPMSTSLSGGTGAPAYNYQPVMVYLNNNGTPVPEACDVNGVPLSSGASTFTLTTLGTGGAATYAGNVFNIPQYQPVLGFTPLNPANNLSDVANAATARANLGLGSAAQQASSAFDAAGAAASAQAAAIAASDPVGSAATKQTNLNCTVTGTGSSQVTTCPGSVAAGTTNPVTIGGASGSCTGLYAKADGTGCGNPGGGGTTTVWNRIGTVMSPTLPAEGDEVYEPNVLAPEANCTILTTLTQCWKMVYSGAYATSGAAVQGLYYAESADGVTWTKNPTAIITGHNRAHWFKNGSAYVITATVEAGNSVQTAIDEYVATASGGSYSKVVSNLVIYNTATWNSEGLGNSGGTISGSTLYLYVEAVGSDNVTRLGLYTCPASSNYFNPCTAYSGNPVANPPSSPSGLYQVGGPTNVFQVGSTYYMFPYASNFNGFGTGQVIASDVYRYSATSLDGPWTSALSGPELSRTSLDEGVFNQVSGQVGGASVVPYNGSIYMFYQAQEPPTVGCSSGCADHINLAVANMSMAQLVATNGGVVQSTIGATNPGSIGPNLGPYAQIGLPSGTPQTPNVQLEVIDPLATATEIQVDRANAVVASSFVLRAYGIVSASDPSWAFGWNDASNNVSIGGYDGSAFHESLKVIPSTWNVGIGSAKGYWSLSAGTGATGGTGGVGDAWGVDAYGVTHSNSPSSVTASVGSVANLSNNNDGEVFSMGVATSVTITFANGGWGAQAPFCVVSVYGSPITAYLSAISASSVTFSFATTPQAIFYHCVGS